MEERILSKMDDAQDSVRLVEENLPEGYKNFESLSKIERDGLYKNVEFAIQNVLDICAIILKEEDLKVPESDESMLEELRSAEILEGETVETIKKMKGFRNYLVHRYGKIDDETAYNDVRAGIKDFKRVFAALKSYISSRD